MPIEHTVHGKSSAFRGAIDASICHPGSEGLEGLNLPPWTQRARESNGHELAFDGLRLAPPPMLLPTFVPDAVGAESGYLLEAVLLSSNSL